MEIYFVRKSFTEFKELKSATPKKLLMNIFNRYLNLDLALKFVNYL